MPRCFFDPADGAKHDDDDEGMELPDDDAARVQAIRYAGGIMSNEPGVLWDRQEFKVVVSKAGRVRLFTIVCYAINEYVDGTEGCRTKYGASEAKSVCA